MLTSYLRDDWKEDPMVEQAILSIGLTTTEQTLRTLFPYRAIARKRLLAYGVPEGALLGYARARHAPAFYPILVMVGVTGEFKYAQHPRCIYVTSEEVQLVENA